MAGSLPRVYSQNLVSVTRTVGASTVVANTSVAVDGSGYIIPGVTQRSDGVALATASSGKTVQIATSGVVTVIADGAASGGNIAVCAYWIIR
jgi:hypothetical protein